MKTRRRNSPDVGITHNSNEGMAISEGLNLIQAQNLISTDDVVVITPNFVQEQTPQSGVVVGPESLRKVIQFAKNSNPRRVVVAAGSGQKSTMEIIKNTGFDKIFQAEGVEFVDLNTGPFTQISLNHDSPATTKLNKLYEEMTFLISFTQLKVHQEATISASIKNIALSWPPAEEHGHPKMNLGIHEKLHGFIRAMLEKLPIDLSIVSAHPAMKGTGPSGGIPVHTGIVLCGTDPVAVDAVGTHLFGFKPQAVAYLYDCIRNGMGIGNVDNMNLKGIPLVEAERIFTTAVYGQSVVIDKK